MEVLSYKESWLDPYHGENRLFSCLDVLSKSAF